MSGRTTATSRSFFLLAKLIVVLLPAAFPSPVGAGTGYPIAVPNPALKAIHGIHLQIDPYWVEGPGYRPVRITATAVAAPNSDRVIRIEFFTDVGNYGREKRFDMTATGQFILPAGKTMAKSTISVPQFGPWNRISWTVYVDDEFAKELSVEEHVGPSTYAGVDAGTRVLVINPDASPRGAIPAPLPIRGPRTRQNAWQVMSSSSSMSVDRSPAEARIGPWELPEKWIDYSSVDVIQMTIDELQTVVESSPKAWTAIRRWVATGGNLLVYRMDKDWSDLDAVEDAFGMRPSKNGASPNDLWMKDAERELSPKGTAFGPAEVDGVRVYDFEMFESDLAMAPKVAFSELPGAHVWRHYRLGMVIVTTSWADVDFRERRSTPNRLRRLWTHRHGVAPGSQGSPDFWNFLIPGVGMAPVGAFRLLITVFVVVIGPVNYFFLRRWRRLHLLLFTVPASAAVLTAALFAYAIVVDGLGTRVRVRSFTEIDQRRNEAVCWARLSYYAGTSPGGLNLPSDTMVVPIQSRSGNRYDNTRTTSRTLDWDDEENKEQHLVQGWLNPRTPTQYMSVRAAPTERKLQFFEAGSSLAVRNELGSAIQSLVVLTKDGNAHWGNNIDADAPSAKLAEIDLTEARIRLGRIFAASKPVAPDALRQRGDVFGLSRNYGGRAWRNNDENYHFPSLATTRLEWALAKYGPLYEFDLKPRMYLAIVDSSPEVRLGLDGCEQVSSFHVVVGHF